MNYSVNFDDMCMKSDEHFIFTIIFSFPYLLLYFFSNLFIFPIKDLINFSNYGTNNISSVSKMSAQE